MDGRAAVRMALGLTRHGVATRLRRRREGSGRPSWSWAFESVIRLLQAERDAAEAEGLARGWDWVAQRRDLEAMLPPSRAVRAVKLAPVRVGAMQAEWCLPPQDDGAVVLFLHGGGYTGGSIATHRDLVARIAPAARARVLSPAYRLAPEHPFPAALDDAVDAVRWLVGQGIAPERIVLMGDSAGGGLVAAALVALRDAGGPRVAGGACLSPWADLTASAATIDANRPFDYCSRAFMVAQRHAYIGDRDPTDPRVSPVFADLTGLPPLLVQAGTAEMLVADAMALASRARGCGVPVELELYEDMPHVFQVLADVAPQGGQAIEALGRFVRRVIAPVRA